jgi:hypothetical protein
MTVIHLPDWDVTAIEIALDLERLQVDDPAAMMFSGPTEPRICLVTCFALTSQLMHVVTAVNRVLPSRLPTLRVASAQRRAGDSTVAVAPMLALLRVQQRFIRAIQPGLGDQRAAIASGRADLDDTSAQFIGDFISNNSVPTFEPTLANSEFLPMRLRVAGITIYSLSRRGIPRSVLGRWPYAQCSRGSVHLRGDP